VKNPIHVMTAIARFLTRGLLNPLVVVCILWGAAFAQTAGQSRHSYRFNFLPYHSLVFQ
jgi:hypothetical protein